MKNTLYLECYSGISGDMTVAALLDLGADREVLEEALKTLPVEGFEIKISRVKKSGLDVCDFSVILDKEHENHDHDMEYLHGSHKHGEEEHTHGEDEAHQHSHIHLHEKSHDHGHVHLHEHSHHHEHRNLSEILHIISHADITPRAKEMAERIFTILAEAEAKAHGTELDEVHFHEVGAVDSIVDIVAAAVCLDNLNITDVIATELCEGHGFVRCQHGIIPVPVPAVVNIAEKHKLSLHITDTEGELVTPTGAAIIAAVRSMDKLPKKFSIEKIGIGAGKRNYDRPSLLRAMLIKDKTFEDNQIYKLESNIDDCTGEMLGYVMELLFKAGARDVHYIPVYMKKNRPAYQLNVVCLEKDIEILENIIFEETTTIGIRRIPVERSVLKRRIEKIMTSLGEAEVKICLLKEKEKVYPEYESVKKLCLQHKLNFQEVYQLIQREYNETKEQR
ncbi:nickel pincer cofactor biosynthesis protein LarC [Fusobacterium varium]|uniref:nickel pincer cofactor biosynthesis protein LarC n=1 Tax=Fusobacterium varium TaxID=856 RepID=UPI0032C1924C